MSEIDVGIPAAGGGTAALQPEMVPSSVSKMNRLGPDFPFLLTTKSSGFVLLTLLKTLPVGADGPVPPFGGGMVTTSGTLVPLP